MKGKKEVYKEYKAFAVAGKNADNDTVLRLPYEVPGETLEERMAWAAWLMVNRMIPTTRVAERLKITPREAGRLMSRLRRKSEKDPSYVSNLTGAKGFGYVLPVYTGRLGGKYRGNVWPLDLQGKVTSSMYCYVSGQSIEEAKKKLEEWREQTEKSLTQEGPIRNLPSLNDRLEGKDIPERLATSQKESKSPNDSCSPKRNIGMNFLLKAMHKVGGERTAEEWFLALGKMKTSNGDPYEKQLGDKRSFRKRLDTAVENGRPFTTPNNTDKKIGSEKFEISRKSSRGNIVYKAVKINNN